MNYYNLNQFIAQVDKDDKVLGKIEKWEAHKKGILHRGFTAIIEYKDSFLVQHRKHPAFNSFFDLSFSSHQIYINNVLQTDTEAIVGSLTREWNLTKKDLATGLKFLGKIYYKAKDPNSIYTEHEIDYIYIVETKVLPVPNFDFAYGFSLIKKSDLKSKVCGLWSPIIAPWVKKIIGAKLV